MLPGTEKQPPPLTPEKDTLDALDRISEFETEKLLRPPAAIAAFVRRIVRGAEYYVGPELRREPRYAVSLPVAGVPVDASLKKAGDAFIALTRDISSSGIAMYHTRRVSEGFLALEIKSASGDKLRVLAEVLRCTPVGLFYEIAAKFVSRLDD
ncbi:MAG TPA: PilZ domain-containing protein [Pirellulales bacterium]|nr:PilZ domain-containing protein [Pirellulales bacterium]